MSQPQSARSRDWFQYVIVVVVVGLIGTGAALIYTNNHKASPSAPTPSFTDTDANSTSAASGGALDSGKNAPPSQASTNDEPPPMLAGNMPPPQASLALGNWYFDHQNWPKAITKYQGAIALGIDNPDVRTDLGSAYRFSGNAQKALEEYKYAHKMNPRHENSLFNQGAVYVLMLKEPQKGVDIWKEYLKEFPKGKSADNAKKLIAQAQKQYNLNK